MAIEGRFVVITATADEDELDIMSYLWRWFRRSDRLSEDGE